jgi:hypothetical protein
MREAFAITGYVPSSVAEGLKTRKSGKVEVAPDVESDDVVMAVEGIDIVEVRLGAVARKQKTLVQLILRDKARVDTVIRSYATPKGVSRFLDPTLSKLVATATAKSIFV